MKNTIYIIQTRDDWAALNARLQAEIESAETPEIAIDLATEKLRINRDLYRVFNNQQMAN